jgi:hypothetical protein
MMTPDNFAEKLRASDGMSKSETCCGRFVGARQAHFLHAAATAVPLVAAENGRFNVRLAEGVVGDINQFLSGPLAGNVERAEEQAPRDKLL